VSVQFGTEFFAAIGRLVAREQAACVEFVAKFTDNPANPGLSLERIGTLWSARVTQELRTILYKEGDAWVLLHVDHHDAAYRWAERRQGSRHPVTGELQIVEVVATQVTEPPRASGPATAASPALLAPHDDAYLLSLGVPPTWLPTLRKVASDDQLLDVAGRLPDDVADRLLRVAAGELVTPPRPVPVTAPLATAAAASSSFVTVTDAGALAAALRQPLDRWLAFLHPSQQALVGLDARGPVKVTGGAGTGKTVVALHRARELSRRGHRVLLTSFVGTLCDNLRRNLRRLCTPTELASITVSTVHKQALALVRAVEPGTEPVDDALVAALLDQLAGVHAPTVDRAFVRAEWDAVIDRQGLVTWAEYRAARRTGRGRALAAAERKALWAVFGGVQDALRARRRATWSMLCRRAEAALATGALASPFDAVVVDEVQDLRPAELRLVRALSRPELVMLCGDAGQRIYPGGFSLGALGIDVRGRGHVLRINYRTTAQIRAQADRILASAERRSRRRHRRTRPRPQPPVRARADVRRVRRSRTTSSTAAVDWLAAQLAAGLAPADLAAFARSNRRVEQLAAALRERDLVAAPLDDGDLAPGAVAVGTMHRAKGLEFKAVLVLSAGADSLPARGALNAAADPADREAVLARERQLLYVAMTRARDLLRVTWAGAPSPFLAPLLAESP
jgi:hypothetical protein